MRFLRQTVGGHKYLDHHAMHQRQMCDSDARGEAHLLCIPPLPLGQSVLAPNSVPSSAADVFARVQTMIRPRLLALRQRERPLSLCNTVRPSAGFEA